MSLSPQNSPATVTVAVINFNGAATLRQTLQSALDSKHIELAGVLLLDNHSTDDSIAIVRREFPSVTIIELPENRGPNPARNEALRRAATEQVLLMDNDIVLEKEYIAKLQQTLCAHPDSGAISGQIRIQDAPDQVQYNGVQLHYAGEIAARSLDARETVVVPCVSAGAALFERSKALAVGGFDEDFFFGWEDGDMTFRLSLAGYPCRLVSEAAAYHRRAARGMKWISLQTRNRWWFMRKNYDPLEFALVFPAICLLQAGFGIFCLCKGQGGAFCRGTWSAFAGFGALRAKRAAVLGLRKVAAADLLQGERLDLPGNFSATRPGRLTQAALCGLLRIYWQMIRPLLRKAQARRCR